MSLRSETDAFLKEAKRLHEAGAVAQAERIYRQILTVNARAADVWNMLGIALFQQDRLQESMHAAQQATELRPANAPYWVSRGNIEAACGREREAQTSFRRAIKLERSSSAAHYWLGRSLHREGLLMDAVAAYRGALRSAPEAAEIHFHLGRALLWAERWDEALRAYGEAYARDPGGELDRRECLDRFRHREFESLPEFWHAEVTRFFRRDDIDKSRYAMTGLRVLMAKPEFRSLRSAVEALAHFEPDVLEAAIQDELFGILLRGALIAQPEFELMLTRLRAVLLLDDGVNARAPVAFLCDLALQCFNNEFVFAETEAETAKVAQLERDVAAGLAERPDAGEPLARAVATWAMYRPLHTMSGIETLSVRTPPAAFGRLLRRTVSNPIEERALRSTIGAISSITDAVSQAVRAQYEEHPYPRWLALDRVPPLPVDVWIRSEVPGLAAPAEFSAPLRLLVAGCGTGVETLDLATRIAGSSVTAVDLSLASLAYAKRKANELGIANVEFRQGDILELGELPQRFEIIYSVGVLVTMREPQAGLRVLARLLRPGGLLKLGLYSERARANVNVARRMIHERGLAATPAAIRAFRQDVYNAAKHDPARRSLLGWRDFYSMSECRDLLFHVEEHQFRLPQIEAMLREQGLTVLGMSKQLPETALLAYRQMFPRDEAMASLRNWDAVEAQHPDIFLGMYQVWARLPAAAAGLAIGTQA